MSAREEQKLAERNIPGMNRHERFGEIQHAANVGGTLKRIITYFIQEKAMVTGMLVIVVFGTLCGVYAPSLQSSAIDIIAGAKEGILPYTILLMLAAYLLYSGSQLLQGLCSAKLSQRIVKRMREEPAVRNKFIEFLTKSLIFHFPNFIHIKIICVFCYTHRVSPVTQFQKNVDYSVVSSFIRPPPVLQ